MKCQGLIPPPLPHHPRAAGGYGPSGVANGGAGGSYGSHPHSGSYSGGSSSGSHAQYGSSGMGHPHSHPAHSGMPGTGAGRRAAVPGAAWHKLEGEGSRAALVAPSHVAGSMHAPGRGPTRPPPLTPPSPLLRGGCVCIRCMPTYARVPMCRPAARPPTPPGRQRQRRLLGRPQRQRQLQRLQATDDAGPQRAGRARGLIWPGRQPQRA